MENCIPEFWEREREWKIAFPTFGNGNGNEKLIPKLWEREWEAGIPGNGREREFPLTPGATHCRLLKGCNSQLYHCFYHMMATDRSGVHIEI